MCDRNNDNNDNSMKTEKDRNSKIDNGAVFADNFDDGGDDDDDDDKDIDGEMMDGGVLT